MQPGDAPPLITWMLVCENCHAEQVWDSEEYSLNEQVGGALRWESAHDCEKHRRKLAEQAKRI